MLSQEAILRCASIKANIATHYKKRLHQYVRYTFHTTEGNVMPPEAYKTHKLHMLQVVVDLCRSKNSEMISPVQFHDWIELYRMLFGLDAILQEDAIEKTLSKTPQLFVPSMRLMNRAFEDGGKHTFSTVPLTWKFRPGFVTFDRITCAEVLKIPLAMQKCRLAKEFVVADVPEHCTSQTCSNWKCYSDLRSLTSRRKKMCV